jgi:quercetin dioxygenase-like cupin family protein
MKRLILSMGLILVASILVLSSTARAQSATPTIIQVMPGEVKWTPSPTFAGGAQNAVIYGSPSKPGLYVILMKFPPHWKNAPHFHSIEQVATVLSGTVYFGLGESYDPNKLKLLPPGSVYTEPLNTPHYAETREEGVILHVTGVGPSVTQYVNPADDPRKK